MNEYEFHGWIRSPCAVGEVLNRLSDPVLKCSRWIDALAKTEPEDVRFVDLEQIVTGNVFRAHYQKIGSCVGQGYARNVQHVILADIVRRMEIEEWWGRVAPCSIYGPSRVEIGGGGLRGDGSVGAWAAESVKRMGVLLRTDYGQVDLTSDDDDYLCVSWGRSGMPDAIEPVARTHSIQEVSLVDDLEVGLACLWNWIPVPTCSMQGFTTTRDRYGMCHPSGRWAHCMATGGAVTIKHPDHPSGLQTVSILQSWGNSNPGGNDKVTLQTGQEITLAPGEFLIDAEVWGKMLRQGDSFGLAGIAGWTPTVKDFVLIG